MLKIVEATEVLPIGIFEEAIGEALIALVEGLFEVVQSDHEPCRQARASEILSVESSKMIVETLPIDLLGKNDQRMA